MKHHNNTLRAMTLLTVGVLFCLGAGTAQCQRSGRVMSRAAAGQASACPPGSASQTNTASPTTQNSTVSGTTAQSNAARFYAPSRQGSGAVFAQRTAANRLQLQWSGDTSNVQRVYLGVLDANGQVLDQRAITQLPVQASLTLTASARYYGVQVVYSNGTSNTMYAPIR